jgi:hypothetical protein
VGAEAWAEPAARAPEEAEGQEGAKAGAEAVEPEERAAAVARAWALAAEPAPGASAPWC